MTTEVIRGNKIIALFDANHAINSPHLKDTEELRYHESFDWIIPVCYKWHQLPDFIGSDLYHQYDQLCDRLDTAAISYSIDDLWEALVSCLTWYNDQKIGHISPHSQNPTT